MPQIVFVTSDGNRYVVDAPPGSNLMDVAVMDGVPGILGDCGGSASCGTCHLIFDESQLARVGHASEAEEALLEGRAERAAGSRLGCQILVHGDLDGLVAHVPSSQF